MNAGVFLARGTSRSFRSDGTGRKWLFLAGSRKARRGEAPQVAPSIKALNVMVSEPA
jgi:hypothetical protein